MKKVVTFPIRALRQAFVVPLKVLFASLGFTFRAGVAVGKLPVRGGAVVSRALGWKILGAVTVGLVVGVVIGRQVERMMHASEHVDSDGGRTSDPVPSGAGVAA